MSDETRGRLAGKSQGAASASEPPEVADALTAPAAPVEPRCTCGESVPTVTTPGPCYWAENAPGVQSQVHCPPPDGVAR